MARHPLAIHQSRLRTQVAQQRIRATGVEVRIRLAPPASREKVDGLYGDRLKIRLTAPPVGGAANEALLRFLSKAVRVAPRSLRIVQGTKDRSKIVLIECSDKAGVARKLRALLAPANAR